MDSSAKWMLAILVVVVLAFGTILVVQSGAKDRKYDRRADMSCSFQGGDYSWDGSDWNCE
jgi:hypothetical protein